MTENKRFRVTLESNTVRFVDFEENKQLMSISFKKHNDAIDCQNALKFQCDLLNDLNDKNEQLKKELNAYKNFSDRKLAENKRIHKDWDKLWQLCKDKGFTEEELIKELER